MNENRQKAFEITSCGALVGLTDAAYSKVQDLITAALDAKDREPERDSTPSSFPFHPHARVKATIRNAYINSPNVIDWDSIASAAISAVFTPNGQNDTQ